jgi:MoaA/NifB/PqqE/SkfB family radical SAM enzyme
MIQNKTEKAKELINQGNLIDAENILKGIENKYSIFELAKIRKIQGRYREAEQLYLKSLSMTSNIKSDIDTNINIELARIYTSFGNIEKAKNLYEKSLKNKISLDNNIYRELGEAYLRIKIFDEAEKYLKKSLQLFPDDILTQFYLSLAYRNIGANDKSKELLLNLLTRKEIKNSKFLYNKVLNEYEILMKKEYLESNPREMRVTITNKCNIGCRYCDIWKVPDWKLSDERMKEIMNYFPYLENMYWLGGETFLYKGFEEILEEGSKYDTLNQTILTNGLLLNERLLEKISKANISLLIAIDAGKKETYEYLRRGASWEKLCKNLELIREVGQRTNKKIITTFNATLSRSNYKEVFDMLEMAHKYDFDRIRFMSILGDSKENVYLTKDTEMITYLENVLPMLENKAKEYNIYMEANGLSLDYKNYNDINVKFVKNNNYHLVKKHNSIKCFEPYRDIVLDSKGPMRPCVGCHDWLEDSSKLSINDFWNCEGMQFFRKKFSTGHVCSISYKASDNGPNDEVSCSSENCWSW